MTTRLVIISISFLIFLIFSSCTYNNQENKEVEGDLYFSWFRIGSFYNQPDSIIQKVKLFADTANREFLDSINLKFLIMYEILKKEDLLYKPFIDLKLDNDSLVKIYFTNGDYNKIKVYKRQDLVDTKMKIRIKMDVMDLGYGMALEKKLISINKVDGQTFQINPKLKIEDYH